MSQSRYLITHSSGDSACAPSTPSNSAGTPLSRRCATPVPMPAGAWRGGLLDGAQLLPHTVRQDLARGEAKGGAGAPEGGCVGVRQRRAIPAPLAARVQGECLGA